MPLQLSGNRSTANMAEKLESEIVATPPAPGFNRTKRRWARGFLWLTAALLVLDHPLFSLASSSCAVYTMHGGTWLSHKNIKWMGASIVSFLVSLYALALRTESDFVDDEKAYELKATLNAKHRMVEIVWGGMLLLLLMLTVKEQIDVALGVTAGVVERVSASFAHNNNGKTQI